MQRICFRLQLRPDRLDEYVERHADVWPEMVDALIEAGWSNYSLFLDRSDGTLIGYFETPDLDAALAGMAARGVNARWQAEMAGYFQNIDGRTPDEGFVRLDQVFRLPPTGSSAPHD
jgi:L-rhamnose mutarotase